MAKRRRKTHRRRTIGRPVLKKAGLTELLAVAGGVVLGRFITAQVAQRLTNIDPKILAGGQVALGIIAQKSRNATIRSLALGVAAGGAVRLVENFGVLNGIGNSQKLLTFKPNSSVGYFENDVVGEPRFNDMQVVAGIM